MTHVPQASNKHIPTYLLKSLSVVQNVLPSSKLTYPIKEEKENHRLHVNSHEGIYFLYTHMHLYRDSTYSYPKHMKIQIKFLAFAFAGGQRYIHEISWGLTLIWWSIHPRFPSTHGFQRSPRPHGLCGGHALLDDLTSRPWNGSQW